MTLSPADRLGIICRTTRAINTQRLAPFAVAHLLHSIHAVTGHDGQYSADEVAMHYTFLLQFVEQGTVRQF